MTDSRLATMAKTTREASSPSRRRPVAARAMVEPIPRRSHSLSATHDDPIGRDATTLTSPLAVAATASAGPRKRLMERTRRASPSRST